MKNPNENGLREVLSKAVRDLKAESGSLMIVDDKTEELSIRVSFSTHPSKELSEHIIQKTRIKMGQSVSGLAAKTRKPLLINDIEELKAMHPEFVPASDSKKYKSSIVVPIIDGAKVSAVLNINNKADGGNFTKEDFNFAVLLADYCFAALKLEKKNFELRTVNDIIREINQTNDLTTVFKMVVEKGRHILNCKNVSVMMIEENRLVVKESTDRSIIGQKRELGVGVSGWVWKTGEPVLIKRMEEAVDSGKFQILNKPGSFIVAPLNLKYDTPFALNVALKSNMTIGVLNFSDRLDSRPFNEEDLDIIVNFANLSAIAIEKVKFFIEVKHSYLSTVEALAAAIDAKDKSSYSHLKRVVRYSLAIADKMGLSGKDKEDIHFAALLHDVGKIGIEEHILNKPGKLTEAEYTRMKLHVEEGVRILMNAQFLENSTVIVKHHHEQYDGSGYPDKLKGEQIPVGSRILAITDSYDAMTSDRVYRKKKSTEESVSELKKCAGKQFDPKIVEVFVGILEENA